MKAKEYLLQIRNLDSLINSMIAEVDHWKEVATSTSAWSDGERVQSSGSKQKMTSAIDKYVDMQAAIDKEIDKLVDKRDEITATLRQAVLEQKLTRFEFEVLHKYYVQELTFYDIAACFDKSYSWATTVHGRALVNLQHVLDERKQHE